MVHALHFQSAPQIKKNSRASHAVLVIVTLNLHGL